MNKVLKRILLVLGSVLVLLVAALLFIRIYFSNDRLRLIAEPILEDQLGREVTIGGFDVALLRSFPDISVGIQEIAIHTPDRNNEEQPDLASIDRIWVEVALFPLLRSVVDVKAFYVEHPQILIEVYDDLSTNLLEGVTGNEEEKAPATDEADTALREIALRDIRVSEAQLAYLHADGTLLTVERLNADIDFRLAQTVEINGGIEIGDLYYETGAVVYADHWGLGLDLNAEASLDSSWLQIKRGDLSVEQLLLQLTGRVEGWDTERIGVNMAFNAPDASVAGFWSLLPYALTRDIAGLESEGVFSVNATIEGDIAEGVLPDVLADLEVRNGQIQYPGMPSSIRDMHLDAQITNERLTVDRFSASAEGATLDLSATVTNFDQPDLRANIQLDADLDAIDQYYPLQDGEAITGAIAADVQVDGSPMEASQLGARGLIQFSEIGYSSPSLQQPIQNLNGEVQVQDERLTLVGITLESGDSDLRVDGSLTGYRSFLLEEIPEGEEPLLQASVTSTHLNVTEQLSEDTTSTFVGPLELPPVRMDVSMNADSFEFNGVTLNDVEGRMTMDTRGIQFEDLSAELFGGVLAASGQFDVSNSLQPAFDGNVSLKQLPVSTFFSTFSDMDAIVRIGSYLEGLFDSEAGFAISLDKDLNPIYKSVVASGLFGAQQGSFGTTPLQQALSGYLGLNDLESLDVQDWSHRFSVSGERLHVQDLALNAGAYVFRVNGSQDFNGVIDYRLTAELPESASNALSSAPIQEGLAPLTSSLNAALVDPESGRITVDLLASGSFDDPQIKLSGEMMKARLEAQVSALAASARQEAQERLDSLENAARAQVETELQEQRDALVDQAEEQVGSLLEGAVDSTVLSTDLDSLKTKGEEALKNKLDGLLNRRRKKNN